jgi:hypothetical protein
MFLLEHLSILFDLFVLFFGFGLMGFSFPSKNLMLTDFVRFIFDNVLFG